MKEGSKADLAQDKREAKKRGMTLNQWENSRADREMDKNPKKHKLKHAVVIMLLGHRKPRADGKAAKDYVS